MRENAFCVCYCKFTDVTNKMVLQIQKIVANSMISQISIYILTELPPNPMLCVGLGKSSRFVHTSYIWFMLACSLWWIVVGLSFGQCMQWSCSLILHSSGKAYSTLCSGSVRARHYPRCWISFPYSHTCRVDSCDDFDSSRQIACGRLYLFEKISLDMSNGWL